MSTKYIEENGVMYQEYEKNGKTFRRRFVENINKIPEEKIPIYKEWRYMRKRCQSKNASYSKYYYKKGIKVCKEWDSLDNGLDKFIEWAVQNGYQEGLSLDRIDSNKDYCPDNCRWITYDENRHLALSQPRKPRWEYKAYNKDENTLLIFEKTIDFTQYTGLDSRRVSDGCKNSEYVYKGWKFERKAINTDYYGSQETIPNGSTLEDELPMEVRIIHLPVENG